MSNDHNPEIINIADFNNDSRFIFNNSFGQYSEDLFEPVIIDGTIHVSLADINHLNIIINDNECSNSFIEAICQQLDRDGIRYTFANGRDMLDVTDSVVLTLDQQYVSGPRVAIMGAYDNNRPDNSDALALAMDTAFRASGVGSDGVFCGKRGYRSSDVYGEVRTRVYTPTEEAIGIDSNTSFATISFGTGVLSPEDTAHIIEEGLARYVAYVSEKNDSDLIYRTEMGDTLDSLASRFGTSSFDISSLNSVDTIVPDETIINPVAYKTTVFDKNIPVTISEVNINKNLK